MVDVKNVVDKCIKLQAQIGVMCLHILITFIKGLLSQISMEAKLDGFRVFKIKNRGEEHPHTDRKYTGPVYVMGLPGDVELFNQELEVLMMQASDPY